MIKTSYGFEDIQKMKEFMKRTLGTFSLWRTMRGGDLQEVADATTRALKSESTIFKGISFVLLSKQLSHLKNSQNFWSVPCKIKLQVPSACGRSWFSTTSYRLWLSEMLLFVIVFYSSHLLKLVKQIPCCILLFVCSMSSDFSKLQ